MRCERPRKYGPSDCFYGHARITGSCGDTMDFWVRFYEERVVEARFMTDGCSSSQAAGAKALELARGRTLAEIDKMDPADVLTDLGGLLEQSEHCALLAVNTLKEAARDYEERRNEIAPSH